MTELSDQNLHHAANQVKPLRGRVILITRAREQADEFAALVAEAGGEPMIFPMLEILPPRSWDPCDEAIRQLNSFDGLILTSTNGAKHFFQRCTLLGVDSSTALANKAVYVVGEKTKSVALSFGISSIAEVPGTYDARHLIELLIRRGAKDRLFLFPKGSRSGSEIREAVKKAGGGVKEVVVYETTLVSGQDEGLAAQKLRDGAIDAITFFSPSSVESFVERMGSRLPEKTRVAAIGTRTAEAIREVSLPLHIVAAESTAQGMISSLIAYFVNAR